MQENPAAIDRLSSALDDHARKCSRGLLLMAVILAILGSAALASGKAVLATALLGACGLPALASAGFAWLARR